MKTHHSANFVRSGQSERSRAAAGKPGEPSPGSASASPNALAAADEESHCCTRGLLWSLLYHYRGQQQTAELFSIAEEMLNIPSKQGSRGGWSRRQSGELCWSAVRAPQCTYQPPPDAERGWGSLREVGLLLRLSLAPLPSPGITEKHKP